MSSHIRTFFVGLLMGACDVVPGVSGGTIAFVSGLYERLLSALKSFDSTVLTLLFQGKIKEIRNRVDGLFLVFLFGGIGTSILIFSKVIEGALTSSPHLVWGLFGGLVVASAFLVGKEIKRSLSTVFLCLLATIGAYLLVTLSPNEQIPTRWMIILSAAIAISAMILPGISGSFLLLILGMYQHVLTAIDEMNIPFLLLFVCGMIIGLMSMVRLVSYVLTRWRDRTLAILFGCMIGALPKLRPWQNVLETVIGRDGESIVLSAERVLPSLYEGQPQTGLVIILFLLGGVGMSVVMTYLNRS